MAYSTSKESPVISVHATGHKPYAICSLLRTRAERRGQAVYLVCLVYPVYLVERNKINQKDQMNQMNQIPGPRLFLEYVAVMKQ